MSLLEENEAKLALIALGRTRIGMPNPTMVDHVAAKLVNVAGPDGERLYEMAQGSPMSERTQLVSRLVDGHVLAHSEPPTVDKVAAFADAQDRHHRYQMWLKGLDVDPYGVQVSEAGGREGMPPIGYRDGPVLSRIIENFDRLQGEVCKRTGLPRDWLWWEHAVGGVLDPADNGRFWFVEVRPPGTEAVVTTLSVSLNNSAVTRGERKITVTEVATLEGWPILSPSAMAIVLRDETDHRMTLAVRQALDDWDDNYGGGPIDPNEDGFTCDTLGAIATRHNVNPHALVAAVYEARPALEATP